MSLADAQSLFEQFYLIDDEQKPQNPNDINSSGFQAKLVFNSFIKEASYQDIMQREETLKKEIHQLDINHQNLVYDNYTKFIAAEETIHSLSGGIDKLLSEMQSVLSSLNVVSSGSTEIRKELKPNRESIQRLVGIGRLMSRIQFISQLPAKLKANIELQEYEAAVSIWLSAEKVFKAHDQYESFVLIKNECQLIIDDIELRVHAQILDPNINLPESVKCASTLLKLHKNSSEILEEFVNNLTEYVFNKLAKIGDCKEPFEHCIKFNKLF
jgi:hypothetical protein